MKKIRYIPYGYTIRDGRTVIEHDEAQIIREIFEEYIKGASLQQIAEELTARKIPYTEKTDVWDKARIARIIDNAKYTGDEEYDPIIDEDTYEGAASMKIARQRNAVREECEGVATIRDRVKCAECGSPMVRRINSKRQVPESWTCEGCGKRLRISDGELLLKIAVLMNRIIENTELLLQEPEIKHADTPAVAYLQRQIDEELERPEPSEAFIMEQIRQVASQLYRQTQAKKMITAQIARKRAMLMTPQKSFRSDYFLDIIDYITLSDTGKVALHTKVDTQITEGEDDK